MDSWKCAPNQRVILELEDSCVIGDMSFMNPEQTRCVLTNCRDVSTHHKFQGGQTFYRTEVLSMRLFSDTVVPTSSADTEQNDSEHTSEPIETASVLDEKDFNSLEKQINRAQYIHSQHGHDYYKAIGVLQEQDMISVSLEDCKYGRHSHGSICSIATSRDVFVFDLVHVKQFYTELKAVLCSPKIIKLVHDSRLVGDHLFHTYKIEMLNVFDTAVAHVAQGGDFKEFRECVAEYLNFPKNFMPYPEPADWSKRPISSESVKYAAQNAVYLFPLYKQMVHGHLLASIYKCTQTYMNSSAQNKDFVDSAMKIMKNKSQAIDAIEDFEVKSPVFEKLGMYSARRDSK